MVMQKRPLSKAEKEAKKIVAAAKEKTRAQMAFSEILSTMGYIAREEVCNVSIELWRSRLNVLRKRGEKIKLKDFLVNATSGDPFNADAPRNQELAEWFVEQWRRFKPGASTVHVRGLHYVISGLADSSDAVYLPNGKVYDNTELRWQDLQRAGKYARYLGLLDPEIFQDRRSKEAVVKEFETGYRSLWVTNELSYDFTEFGLPGLPSFPDFPELPGFPSLPRYYLSFRGQQRYRLEVWIEKSTQEDVILPVCDRYQVTSVTAQGEISVSSMWKAIKRAEKYKNTTTVILYISDFDPAGKSMPVAAARKLEFLRMLRRSNVDMRLYPIALTHEQCVQYQLPRTPIKETDMRRSGFEDRYGDGATELDALEALHPGELAKLLERAILKFRDNTVPKRVSVKREEIAEELRGILSKVHAAHETVQTYPNEFGWVRRARHWKKGLSP